MGPTRVWFIWTMAYNSRTDLCLSTETRFWSRYVVGWDTRKQSTRAAFLLLRQNVLRSLEVVQ
jgi:hypothetical protein